MNKANLYLYQHPLFTVSLLTIIGFVFGMCVVILIFETLRTVWNLLVVHVWNRMMKLMEAEEVEAAEEAVDGVGMQEEVAQEGIPENETSEE